MRDNPTIPVEIPAGVVRGATPAQSPGRWYDTNLIRWREGYMQPVGGRSRVSATALASTVRDIQPWLDNSFNRWVAYACDDKLYVDDLNGTRHDATPSGFVGVTSLLEGGYGTNDYNLDDYNEPHGASLSLTTPPFSFTLETWGEELLALMSSDGRLHRWRPAFPTTIAAPISGAPTNNRAMVVTPQRHVMLFGLDNKPRRVGWCSREDYTDWNFASDVNTAGFYDIDTAGLFIAARVVGNDILGFTESEVWLFRYIGEPFIYDRECIGQNCGPLSPQSIAVVGSRAFWPGAQGFWQYDGGQVRPLPCDVNEYFYRHVYRLGARFHAMGAINGVFPEYWLFYPDEANVENNRYLFYNYEFGHWGIGRMACTAMHPATGMFTKPLAAFTDKNIYQMEDGYLDAGASRIGDVYAECGAVSLEGGGRVASIGRAEIDTDMGAEKTKVTYYGRFSREGEELSYGPYTPRADGFVDARFKARDIRMRVENTQDGDWTVGAMRLHRTKTGSKR